MSTQYQMPNLPNILRDRLRATAFSSLITTSDQVLTRRISKVDVYAKNVVHLLWDGGRGRNAELPIAHARVVAYCYGSTDSNATDLADDLARLLVPYGPFRGWVGTGYAVTDVLQPGLPLPYHHPDYDTPFARAAFEFRVRLKATN